MKKAQKSNSNSQQGVGPSFVKFVILVLLACVVAVVGIWSYSNYRKTVLIDRVVDKASDTLDRIDNAITSPPIIDKPSAVQSTPPESEPKPVQKPLTEFTDDEKNRLWWEIAETCKTDNFVPDGKHTIDTYKLRPIATRLGVSVIELSSFWRSGESSAWRTLEKPSE